MQYLKGPSQNSDGKIDYQCKHFIFSALKWLNLALTRPYKSYHTPYPRPQKYEKFRNPPEYSTSTISYGTTPSSLDQPISSIHSASQETFSHHKYTTSQQPIHKGKSGRRTNESP